MKRPPRKHQIPDFARVARVVVREATRVAEAAAAPFAEAQRRAFQARIRRQAFDAFAAFPLSPRYLARKRAAGADPRTMIATGFYLSHIRVWRHRDARGGLTLRIGFHPAARARDLRGRPTGILLSAVGAINEHGSAARGIPARPHWGPMARQVEAAAVPLRKRVAVTAAAAINRVLRKGV